MKDGRRSNKGRFRTNDGYFFNHKHVMFIIKLIVFLFCFINTGKKLRIFLNFGSKVHLVIRGNGYQDVLSTEFNYQPSMVLVNGISKTLINKSFELDYEGENNVVLIFRPQIRSCRRIFLHLGNITEIDLSNFNFFDVATVEYMFHNCSNLKKKKFW